VHHTSALQGTARLPLTLTPNNNHMASRLMKPPVTGCTLVAANCRVWELNQSVSLFFLYPNFSNSLVVLAAFATHTHTRTLTHTHAHIHTHTHTRTNTHTHTHTRAHTHAHTRTHICTRAYTHARTRTHTKHHAAASPQLIFYNFRNF